MNKLLQKSFVALAASAFLVACSDDSSDSFGEGAEGVSCTVVKKDPLVIEAVEEGFYSKTTFEFDDGDVIETVEFENHKAVQLACSQYTKDPDYKSVECSDKSIVAVGKETFTASEYKRMMDAFATECEKMSDVKSSLSSAKSSSSTKSSSSVESSSSSAKSSSSSQEQSSSSVQSSSSQGYSSEEITPVSSSSKTEDEKVVASNADELDCPAEEPADLTGFDVAYEFNDPYDMGHDYIGKEDAYLKAGVPTVSAECNAMVLDGTNGLYIPLSDVFKNKGFVFEVRFMPLQESSMGNIFVAEPPGSGKTGWQLRLDGDEVRFHFRDAEMTSSWNTSTVGEVTLNEWHVVRVKIFPAKSELSGVVFYSLNLSLDGSIRYASEFKADLSKLEFNLGIGYDSMNQSSHQDRFFVGKIDYIRYGKVSEDDL